MGHDSFNHFLYGKEIENWIRYCNTKERKREMEREREENGFYSL